MSYTPKEFKVNKSKEDKNINVINIIAFSLALMVSLIVLGMFLGHPTQPDPVVKAQEAKEPIMEAIKPAPKFTVTIYNHDGSIRGEYRDVTYWKYYQPSYKVSSNNIVELPEYGVQFLGEFTIYPQKD